jgi:hypothetical protein
MQEKGNTYGHKKLTPVAAICIGKKLGEKITIDGNTWIIKKS